MTTYLEFEKPIAELESKISELRHLPNSGDVDIAEEVMRLQVKVDKLLRATYAKLTSWQRVQVARHAERPHAQRYIDRLVADYMPLAGDRVYMLENSIYSVITPEGCASILWRDGANAQDAAEAMKVTAGDLKKLEVIDEVIPEPMGGAHRGADETIDLVGKVVSEALTD